MRAYKPKVPGSSRQDNLPIIKSGIIIFGLMIVGFVFLILQIIGL